MKAEDLPATENINEAHYNNRSKEDPNETGRALNCWVVEKKVILVLGEEIVVFNYDNLSERPVKIGIKELEPLGAFFGTARRAFNEKGQDRKFRFWVSIQGTLGKMIDAKNPKRVQPTYIY